MRIRDAGIEEVDFIRKQRVAAYRDYAALVPDAHWKALERAITSDADIQPGVELIVAEINGRIAGSVALFPPLTDAYEGNVEKVSYPEIRMLAVSAEHRGVGVAGALIEECIRRSRLKNCQAIGLHTGEFMAKAIQLYTRFGFERMPQYDFQPADDGIKVLAFRLQLDKHDN